MPKKLNSTYLYSVYSKDYEKLLLEVIMQAERIDTSDDAFEDIAYDVGKRQVSNNLVKVMQSNNIVLFINSTPMPKAFKVFAANDIKGDKKLKIWIDCSNIISKDKGKYICKDVDILISYLVDAMVTFIYNVSENTITKRHSLSVCGSEAFAKIFGYIMDYLYKTNTISDMKEKVMFMSVLYYNHCILGNQYDSDGVVAMAKKVANISDRAATAIMIDLSEDNFINLKFFIEALSEKLRLSKLSTEIVVEKWMYIFGTGTVFALEMFPAFSAMITDAYVGAYINNQKNIEKVIGTSMVQFSKDILRMGETV